MFANRDRRNETVRVEVLYFDGCPSYAALMASLPGLMARAGVDEPIEFRAVESVRAAEQERFLGSPTLRIDGQDVEPAASQRSDFGLKCRLYPSAAAPRGAIPDEFVLDALARAQDSRRESPGIPQGQGHARTREELNQDGRQRSHSIPQ